MLFRMRSRYGLPVILAALLAYTLVGVFAVPFHGDEATIITLGGDYSRLSF